MQGKKGGNQQSRSIIFSLDLNLYCKWPPESTSLLWFLPSGAKDGNSSRITFNANNIMANTTVLHLLSKTTLKMSRTMDCLRMGMYRGVNLETMWRWVSEVVWWLAWSRASPRPRWASLNCSRISWACCATLWCHLAGSPGRNQSTEYSFIIN